MRKTAFTLLTILTVLMLLASCATSKTQPAAEPAVVETQETTTQTPNPEPEPEPTPVPDPEPAPAPAPAQEQQPDAPAWTIGQKGSHGGLVFQSGKVFLETGDVIYETPSYDQVIAQIKTISSDSGVSYRLPTIDELKALYEQLVITELSDVEWTYYWSSDESADGNVRIMNFDTGFEGRFYKDMDFVSAIPVTEI